MGRIRHGIISLKQNGKLIQATGDFTYNFGNAKNEPLFGSGGEVVADKQTPQEPYIRGVITIQSDTDEEAFTQSRDTTVTLNGDSNTYVLTEATYSGDGEANTGDGSLQAEWYGVKLKKI